MQIKSLAPANIDEFSIEDLRFNPPDFSEAILSDVLKDHYGVVGSFKRLAGERDQNFRITTAENTKYVFKISGPEEEESLIDFQIKALLHLEVCDMGLPVPRIILNRLNEPCSILVSENKIAHAVRLLSYVEGVPIHTCGELSHKAIMKIGEMTGRLCRALSEFEHAASHHFMPWDIMNGLIFSKNLCANHLPANLRNECLQQLDRLRKDTFPKILALPSQVIHNDAHTGNVMCDPQNVEIIKGIIDFGDMINRPVIVDMAVSLSSLIDQNPNVSDVSIPFINGYKKYVDVSNEELELLFDAILARAIMNVQLLDFRVKNIAGLTEVSDRELPDAIKSLKVLLGTDPIEFLSAIKNNQV